MRKRRKIGHKRIKGKDLARDFVGRLAKFAEENPEQFVANCVLVADKTKMVARAVKENPRAVQNTAVKLVAGIVRRGIA